MKLLCCLFTLCSLLTPASLWAQVEFDETKLIPSSAMAAIFVRPKAIFEEPTLELLPREIVTELGKTELGFDPCKIVKAMVLIDAVEDLQRPPNFALVLAFDSKQSPGEKITQNLEKGELNGKTVYRGGEFEPAIYQPNDHTIVFGNESFFKKMISAKGSQSKLISLVGERGTDSHVSVFVTIEPVRAMINDSLPPQGQIPAPFHGFLQLPDLIEALVLQLDFSENQNGKLEVVANDDASVERIEEILQQGIAMGRSLGLEYLSQAVGSMEPGLQSAVQAYGNRVADYLEAHFFPKRSGRSLVFEDYGSGNIGTISTMGTLIGMLLPAVQQAREAARRTSAMNTLRQFALAAHNYASVHRSLPQNIVDDQGQPLLSWRVQILPYLEEMNLYEQFHLDEPWDSEHNIKLLDQMPAIFGNPNLKESNKTVFLGFEGEETMFPGEKIGLQNVTDGTSNTILVVEANPDVAIEWTRPSDIPFDPDRPVTEVGELRPGGFNAVFADGAVHFIQNGIDPQVLSRLIQRADGNVTGFNQ